MNNEKRIKPLAHGIYFGIVICFVIIRMLSAFGVFSGLGSWFNLVFSIVGQIILLFGGSVFIFSAASKNKVKDTLTFYGYRKIAGRTVILCFLMGIVVFFLNVFISSFFGSILEWIGYRSGSAGGSLTSYPIWLLLVNLILTAVLPAICEETAHRGMLLNTKMGKNYKWSIIISSAMFALLHMNIDQVFYAFVIGLFLGYITFYTKTIYPAMIIHFSNNALSVLLTYSNVKGTSLAAIFNQLAAIISSNVILGVVLLIALIFILVSLLIKLTKSMFIVNATSQIYMNKEALDKLIQRETFFSEVREIKGEPQQISNPNCFLIKSDEVIRDLFNIREINHREDTISRIFMWLSIILMTIATIFTFVWGIL